mmetsp:Transcript_26951/g.58824  ORF Transcript_26951/g.58824 Transcript_26951/m.58824 type:complete len:204 (-) Transcript_26951:777-1388(-)
MSTGLLSVGSSLDADTAGVGLSAFFTGGVGALFTAASVAGVLLLPTAPLPGRAKMIQETLSLVRRRSTASSTSCFAAASSPAAVAPVLATARRMNRTACALVVTSQRPSEATIRYSSSASNLCSRTSGVATTGAAAKFTVLANFLVHDLSITPATSNSSSPRLNSKSPKALDTARIPSTRPSLTQPPALFILSTSRFDTLLPP